MSTAHHDFSWIGVEQPLRGNRRFPDGAGSGCEAVGRIIPRAAAAGQSQELHAAAERAAASRRLAVRQGQRRVDPREVQGMGLAGGDRAVRRALPDAERTAARAGRAGEVHREARRTGRRHRSHLGPEGRAAAVVQRVLDRRRRDRAARVRQLRAAGRLRPARSPGRLGPRRHRHRALRAIVARHQAEGRRRTRRGRMPDLLRIRETTAIRPATCSPRGRCVRATASSAAASWTCRSTPAIR